MPTGLTKDAGWQIGLSRTVQVPLDAVWAFLVSAEGTSVWLGPGALLAENPGVAVTADDGGRGEVRSFRPGDRVRLTWQPAGWDHDSTVQIALRPSASGGTSIRFHQERLIDADQRERQRTHWQAVLAEVIELL